MNKERGITDWIVLLVGVVMVLLLIGFFNADRGFFDKINYKTALQLKCGLTVSDILDNQQISFPLHVKGYINGCGWEMNAATAGTVQIFDGKGAAVTPPEQLIYDDNGTEIPRAFVADLHATAAPSVDTGNLVFISSAGIVKAIPVKF